jgi:prevent-host-death family protein
MDKTVTAADANRRFSEILREAREGQTFVVTSHGRPVARIAPISEGDSRRDAARDALLKRLRRQPLKEIGNWRRDELYED